MSSPQRRSVLNGQANDPENTRRRPRPGRKRPLLLRSLSAHLISRQSEKLIKSKRMQMDPLPAEGSGDHAQGCLGPCRPQHQTPS